MVLMNGFKFKDGFNGFNDFNLINDPNLCSNSKLNAVVEKQLTNVRMTIVISYIIIIIF